MRRHIRKALSIVCCCGMILCGGEAGIVNAEQNGVYANEQNNKNEKVEKKGWVYNDSRFGLSYYENNKPVTGWKTIDGVKFYFDEKGILLTGYQTIDSKPYYLGGFSYNDIMDKKVTENEKGLLKITTGQTGASGLVYVEDDLSLAIGWKEVEGIYYYFGTDGMNTTGWKEIDGKWYYFGERDDAYGAYTNGWKDGYWLDENGCWSYPSKITWYKDSWGWYIWDESGWYPTSSWQKIDGKWYYFDEWGYMVRSSWRNIGGVYYYFNFDGTLQCNAVTRDGEETGQWIDGYWVDHNGAWTGYTGSWYWDGTGYQLWDNTGWYAKDTTQIVDNYYIDFDSQGYAVYYGERLTKVPPMGGTGSATKNGVVQYASRVLGFPYVYGGQTLAGTDCSGFTMLSWKSAGVNMPHNAGMQYTTYQSHEVWISEVQPGDLLFYMSGDTANDYGTGIGHVALYIGNGETLEAGHQTSGRRWYADKAAYVMK